MARPPGDASTHEASRQRGAEQAEGREAQVQDSGQEIRETQGDGQTHPGAENDSRDKPLMYGAASAASWVNGTRNNRQIDTPERHRSLLVPLALSLAGASPSTRTRGG